MSGREASPALQRRKDSSTQAYTKKKRRADQGVCKIVGRSERARRLVQGVKSGETCKCPAHTKVFEGRYKVNQR